MKVAIIAAISGVVLLCGCASNRAYRAGPGGASGAGALPSSPSTLGLPSPTFSSPGNSSSYGPGSGPTLGLPEAKKNPPPAATRTSQLEAPDPKLHAKGSRTEPAAETVSSSGRPAVTADSAWSRFYRSTEQRPIETVITGSGPERIAILASLHGDETQSVSLVEELARWTREQPESRRKASVLFIRSPNPDGLFSRSPWNVSGVDLNRNFPSANWQELKNGRSGNRSASEAETRVIVRILSDFHPTLVVHLKDTRQSGVVNYEGDIQPRAEQIAEMLSVPVVSGLGGKTTGSVENYAMTRLSCPSLTLLLAREASDEAAWAKNHDALLALVGEIAKATEPADRSRSFDSQPDPFEERPVQKSSLKRERARDQTTSGRSVSAPAGTKRAPLPEFKSAIPDHGYLELPPP
jgi:protein MpaA